MRHTVPFGVVEQRLHQAGLLLGIEGDRPSTVSGVTEDSRHVLPGSLFVAISGRETEGARFAADAIARGACAIVAAEGQDVAAETLIRVTDTRRALSELAALMAGDPGKHLTLLAVTGTNGKTTTATLLAEALDRLGRPCGFIGTTGYRIGGEPVPASHTTPSAPRLQALLAVMRERDLTACALEASSHALDQARVRPEDMNVAVFTNLTRDHLDYHGSWEAYLAAKKALFDGLTPDALAVVNADDPASDAMVSDCRARVIRVGTGSDADIQWTLKGLTADGLDLTIDGHAVPVRLSGRFNAVNVSLSWAALTGMGHAPADVARVLGGLPPVRGRFEVLPLPGGRTAVVDYAHTPDALENVLDTARELVVAPARLWVVFGCGGDRDRGKRPIMGRVAATRADRVVLTSDNPRSEDPAAILGDILAGMDGDEPAFMHVDRSVAIAHALQAAGPGDVVVVAGKGHETTQVIGSVVRPFDDRAVVLHTMET